MPETTPMSQLVKFLFFKDIFHDILLLHLLSKLLKYIINDSIITPFYSRHRRILLRPKQSISCEREYIIASLQQNVWKEKDKKNFDNFTPQERGKTNCATQLK